MKQKHTSVLIFPPPPSVLCSALAGLCAASAGSVTLRVHCVPCPAHETLIIQLRVQLGPCPVSRDRHLLPKLDVVLTPCWFLIFPVGPENVKHVSQHVWHHVRVLLPHCSYVDSKSTLSMSLYLPPPCAWLLPLPSQAESHSAWVWIQHILLLGWSEVGHINKLQHLDPLHQSLTEWRKPIPHRHIGQPSRR